MLRAMTEFCHNGRRYERDEEVIVSWKEAEKLKANRVVYGTIDQVVPSTDRPHKVSKKQAQKNRKAVARAKKTATEKASTTEDTETAEDGEKATGEEKTGNGEKPADEA